MNSLILRVIITLTFLKASLFAANNCKSLKDQSLLSVPAKYKSMSFIQREQLKQQQQMQAKMKPFLEQKEQQQPQQQWQQQPQMNQWALQLQQEQMFKQLSNQQGLINRVPRKTSKIQSRPVTQYQWARIMQTNPSKPPKGPNSILLSVNDKSIRIIAEQPVENATPQEIRSFVSRLNQLSKEDNPLIYTIHPDHRKGDRYRLPTQAEKNDFVEEVYWKGFRLMVEALQD